MVFINADFTQYITEFLILIGSGIYIIIANHMKGINILTFSDNEDTKKWNKNLIIAGFIAIILNDILIRKLGIVQSKLVSIIYLPEANAEFGRRIHNERKIRNYKKVIIIRFFSKLK